MSQQNQFVVVWDPEGKYWEGAIVEQSMMQQIKARGGVVLPVDPMLFTLAGDGGFFKRAWGAGWPCDHTTPKSFCPLTLFLTKAHTLIYWAARLVPDKRYFEVDKGGPVDDTGQINIMSLTQRANTFQAPLTPRTGPKRIRDLGPADEHGGWTIDGHAFANVAFEGHHSFSLYGTGKGVQVAWAAITAARA